jgi:hypothetical protein
MDEDVGSLQEIFINVLKSLNNDLKFILREELLKIYHLIISINELENKRNEKIEKCLKKINLSLKEQKSKEDV